MDTARYGRMQFGRCISKEYGYVGCSQEVLEYSDSRCSGRRHCQMPVSDFLKEQLRPCPKDVTPYFEASYRCVQGEPCVRVYSIVMNRGLLKPYCPNFLPVLQ